MKIKEYWIENFQSLKGHFDIVCDDDKNLNLLNGSNNGVGKSSVFLNFYFMLCSTTSTNIEEYLNWDSDSMASHLVFEHDGNLFTIDYSYKKNKSEKTLKINDETYEGPATVSKVLKEYFDPSIFTTATAIMQGERNFVKTSDSERREQLKKLFNTDFSKEVKDLDKEIKSFTTDTIEPLEKSIVELKAKEFNVKDLIKLPYSEEVYNESKEKKNILNDKISKNKVAISNANVAKEEKKNLESEIEKLEKSIKEEDSNKVAIETEILNLVNYKRDETTLNNLEKEHKAITIIRPRIFNDTELESKKVEASNISSEIRQLEKELASCDTGVCPTCNRPFENTDVHSLEQKKKDIELSIQTKKNNLKDVNSIIDSLKKEKLDCEKVIEDNNENKRKKEVLATRIESEKTRLDTIEENNKKSQIEKEQQLIKVEALIDNKKVELEDKKNKLLKIVVKDVSELEKENEQLEQDLFREESVIKSNDDTKLLNTQIEKDNVETELKKKENQLSIIEKEEELKEKLFEREELKKMKDILRVEFPSYVISSIITEIEDSMNEFINSVYYKSLDVKIEGNDESIKATYGTGKKKVSTTHASGAEEALLAISYAYALNKMNGFNILFLDECDSQMNEENSLQFAELILDIKDMYDDIWIISHKTRAKDLYASNDANVVMIA